MAARTWSPGLWVPPVQPQVVDGDGARDAVEIVAQVFRPAAALQRGAAAQKRVLRQILGQVRVAQHPRQVGTDVAAMAAEHPLDPRPCHLSASCRRSQNVRLAAQGCGVADRSAAITSQQPPRQSQIRRQGRGPAGRPAPDPPARRLAEGSGGRTHQRLTQPQPDLKSGHPTRNASLPSPPLRRPAAGHRSPPRPGSHLLAHGRPRRQTPRAPHLWHTYPATMSRDCRRRPAVPGPAPRPAAGSRYSAPADHGEEALHLDPVLRAAAQVAQPGMGKPALALHTSTTVPKRTEIGAAAPTASTNPGAR